MGILQSKKMGIKTQVRQSWCASEAVATRAEIYSRSDEDVDVGQLSDAFRIVNTPAGFCLLLTGQSPGCPATQSLHVGLLAIVYF